MQYLIGNGIDFHQLEEGLPLIIGGVSIPYSRGSKGHSDGDVLFHAIVDAILGSLALGDIMCGAKASATFLCPVAER